MSCLRSHVEQQQTIAAMECHQVGEGQVQPQLPVPLSAAVRGTLPQLQAGPQLAGRQRQLPGESLEL